MSLEVLKSAQRAWAVTTGRILDAAGYVGELDQNLVVPLCKESLGEFSRGSGGELTARRHGPGKLFATHSSAALACNAFEYWRTRGWGFVEMALALPAAIDCFRYEAPFPTGLPGEPPSLDVAFKLRNGSIWAIESKFTEPFGAPKRTTAALKDKYFPGQRPIWSDRGLPACGDLALAVRNGDISFRRLDVAQLLKHALGLKARGRPFVLSYMWLDTQTPAGDEHRSDIGRFARAVGAEISFKPTTYQEFIARLRRYAGRDHDLFFTYFAERYGCETQAGFDGPEL